MSEPFNVHIMISNHHVHLSKAAEKVLFGEEGVTFQRWLGAEGGSYACNETVTIAGPKGSISGLRVLGPCRDVDEAEILTSDTFKLGITAPYRCGGNMEGAATLTLIGPKGSVESACGIVPYRHIHVGANTLAKFGLDPKDEVSVHIDGIRGGTLDNVRFKLSRKNPDDPATMHIDREEGNAMGIGMTATGTVVLDK